MHIWRTLHRQLANVFQRVPHIAPPNSFGEKPVEGVERTDFNPLRFSEILRVSPILNRSKGIF